MLRGHAWLLQQENRVFSRADLERLLQAERQMADKEWLAFLDEVERAFKDFHSLPLEQACEWVHRLTQKDSENSTRWKARLQFMDAAGTRFQGEEVLRCLDLARQRLQQEKDWLNAFQGKVSDWKKIEEKASRALKAGEFKRASEVVTEVEQDLKQRLQELQERREAVRKEMGEELTRRSTLPRTDWRPIPLTVAAMVGVRPVHEHSACPERGANDSCLRLDCRRQWLEADLRDIRALQKEIKERRQRWEKCYRKYELAWEKYLNASFLKKRRERAALKKAFEQCEQEGNQGERHYGVWEKRREKDQDFLKELGIL
ncbi:hypothetical protein D6833_13050 [Candidatus Parcubacteria bacterium]|nr:MAG: hypothetical protein D6833_13050 [Candidatus Parcubacteria bacterium]